MLLELFFWWYGAGWLDIARRIGKRVVSIMQIFSVSILMSTLFSPWRRIITPPGRSIDQILRGMIDNAVSRTIGFIVRVLVLITATIMTVVDSIVGFIFVVIWPLLPVAAVYCLVRGVIG